MNQYATLAKKHWQQFRPTSYREIEDPDSFFEALGREVEEQIKTLTHTLAGPDLPKETYMQKLGRLTAAEQQAREKVLAEQVLLPAEPGSEMDETNDLETDTVMEDTVMPTASIPSRIPDPTSTDREDDDLFPQEMRTDWIPVEEQPNHPFWAAHPDPDNTEV